MAEMKYAKYIITEPKEWPPEALARMAAGRAERKSTIKSTRLMSVDSEILPGFFYVDCAWLWSGGENEGGGEAHTHDFDEVIGFIGSNRDDPHDLGGEVTIYLDGKKEVLTQTCLIFVPAGVPHCPYFFNRIDKPIFFVTISPSGSYTQKDKGPVTPPPAGEPRYTIVTRLKERFSVAASGEEGPPPPPPNPSLKGARILHLEDDVAKGAFYVDFVWIYEGTGAAPAPVHTHDWPELIAMAGCDPERPHHLGGKMSIVLGDEDHIIERSSLVCIPPGLKHCPWRFLDIKKPTLVFTAGPSAMYSGSHKKD